MENGKTENGKTENGSTFISNVYVHCSSFRSPFFCEYSSVLNDRYTTPIECGYKFYSQNLRLRRSTIKYPKWRVEYTSGIVGRS